MTEELFQSTPAITDGRRAAARVERTGSRVSIHARHH